MASASRWSLSDRKTVTVGTLIVFGIFILACGVGMTNIAVGGLGMAVAVLGPLLIVMTGLRGGTREFVFGTAHVHQASPLPTTGAIGRCELELVINAQGVNGIPVHTRDHATPVNKWPDVGATLPVKVDPRDPRQVQILWDEVRTHREIEFDDTAFPEYAEADTEDELLDYPDFVEEPPSEPLVEPLVEPHDEPLDEPLVEPHDETHRQAPDEAHPASADNDSPGAGSQHATGYIPDLTKHPEPPAPADAADTLPPANSVNRVSVTLIVSDLDRSREFYQSILGLDEIDTSPASAVLAFGDARVILRQVSDMPPIDRRVVHLNLDVSDVQEAYDRLKAKGVEFVHRPKVVPQGEHLELCSATFRDPDGHAIAITRWIVRP